MGALLFSLLLAEVILHAMIQPSDESAGRLLDMELPPLRVIPANHVIPTTERHKDPAEDWCEPVTRWGEHLTHGDLHGIMREDEKVGYAPRENAVSVNGWWQSNNLGARSRIEMSPLVNEGVKRVLLFGESYIQGSRVPQNETIERYLSKSLQGVEVGNFGVDGYSMGQAYLRYLQLHDKLEYDHVILVFVAIADLWREINVSRAVGQNWDSYMINPRFLAEDGTLRLVPAPYSNFQELLQDNREEVSLTLKDHLRMYDAFFFKSRFESTPILDHSVIFRLVQRSRAKKEQVELWKNLMNPESEAMQVTVLTANAMSRKVSEMDSRFSFVILPTLQEIRNFKRSEGFRLRWKLMSQAICAGQFECHDFMHYFQKISLDELDVVCDKWHFGPATNRHVAKAIISTILN